MQSVPNENSESYSAVDSILGRVEINKGQDIASLIFGMYPTAQRNKIEKFFASSKSHVLIHMKSDTFVGKRVSCRLRKNAITCY